MEMGIAERQNIQFTLCCFVGSLVQVEEIDRKESLPENEEAHVACLFCSGNVYD